MPEVMSKHFSKDRALPNNELLKNFLQGSTSA
jgi:hypothetical protein